MSVKLTWRGRRVARRTLTVPGGTTRSFRLRLSKAARSKLAARRRLKVTATVSARDAAGNRRTTRYKITLRAPAR